MPSVRAIAVWAALAVALIAPIVIAATSPQLAWREPIYIVAGFAGVAAMALLLLQPLLAGGYLPGLARRLGRKVHVWVGGLLVAAVVVHVAALWVTSPPDVVDALLFRSPTPFSAWGVIAMWAVFAAALLALLRHKLGIRPSLWRLAHTVLALVVVSTSVAHALLIEGTMGTASKVALCTLALAAIVKAAIDLRSWSALTRGKARTP